jgi:hypothetical protein
LLSQQGDLTGLLFEQEDLTAVTLKLLNRGWTISMPIIAANMQALAFIVVLKIKNSD